MVTTHPLLPDPQCLTLDAIHVRDGVIVLAARTRARTARCPLCGHAAERIHSCYRRNLQDLSWQGNPVRVALTLRKWFCDNRGCPRRIFAEPIASVAARYARKTCRLLFVLQELAYRAGGEAAARIARALGLFVSPDTLLHCLRRRTQTTAGVPQVLGVDDFAFRKGHTYGTVLVDQEKHCVVDLLPDRDAETLASWLKAHPGVQIVSRDRSELYRRGITAGAPEATQVADRWHLLKNLGDVLEGLLERQHRFLGETVQHLMAKGQDSGEAKSAPDEQPEAPEQARGTSSTGPLPSPLIRLTPTEKEEQAKAQRHARKEARYERVRELHRQGFDQSAIERQTGLSRKTIRTYLCAPTCPQYPQRAPRPGRLTPFAGYLKQRWDEGCHSAAALYREIAAMGYAGKPSTLRDFLRPWRVYLPEEERRATTGVRSKRRLREHVPSAATVRWWLLGHLSKTDEAKRAFQQAFAERLCGPCPEVESARVLSDEFARLVKERRADALEAWLKRAETSAVPELCSFAKGLLQDGAAVQAALSFPWSNGQTEGQVNRLKTIKRSAYGRASFDLLRPRVLPLSA